MSNDSLTEPQRAWVEALRSGRYKQTTHVLCRLDEHGEPVGYCCLGVACELAREAGVVSVGRRVASANARRYGDSWQWLPETVKDWLGLASLSGRYEGDALTEHNDSGDPFERIADIIESAPKGLFVEPSA